MAGLLLIGLAADQEGAFAWAGGLLARSTKKGLALYVWSVLLVSVTTALLNLDTSVAFLTPVLLHSARQRNTDERPYLEACILLSNAASLLLPGSNLTNLIVLGHLHLTGSAFLERMWLPWAGAVGVTACVVAAFHSRGLLSASGSAETSPRPSPGPGMAGVAIASALVLVLPSPALPVLVTGLVVTAANLVRRRVQLAAAARAVGLPVLAGLFAVAVALGTVGRIWSGPSALLSRLGPWATASMAAVSSVVVNNLPAASLLAARIPPHPFAMLVGLDVGPNLFATGSLAWFLWYRCARNAGASPSLFRTSALGASSALFAMAVAVLLLGLTSSQG